MAARVSCWSWQAEVLALCHLGIILAPLGMEEIVHVRLPFLLLLAVACLSMVPQGPHYIQQGSSMMVVLALDLAPESPGQLLPPAEGIPQSQ